MRTAIGGLRPWKFWSSLRPDQKSRPKRLIVYWGASLLIVLMLLVAACAAVFVKETARYNAYVIATAYYRGPFPSGSNFLPSFLTQHRHGYLSWYWFRRTLVHDGTPFWAWWAGCVAWPWLTLAILMIFRVSMRRAKVKTEHVLRCVLYSGDAFLWPALLVTASVWIEVVLFSLGIMEPISAPLARPVGLAVALLCMLPAVKLWAAYRKYLRFRHALGTIVASQVILVLAVVTAILNLP